MQTLENLLIESAIVLNYPAKDVDDIVGVLGNLLFEAGLTKESFVPAALAREKEMPTGLPLSGDYNAAIPHTDIEHVLKPGVAFATLTEPVHFHNMALPNETVKVSMVFLLALDKPKAQIAMLQEIARLLQNAKLIENLMTATECEEVFRIIRNKEIIE